MSNCSIDILPSCSYKGELIAYMGVITPVCLLGVIFNSLLLAVLQQPGFKHGLAIFTIIRVMALMNLFVCCLVLPIGLFRCVQTEVYWQLYAVSIYDVYIYLPISNFFGMSSLFLIVAMVLDIYIGIQFREVAKKWCTVKNAWRIFAFVLVMSFGMNAPLFFYQKVEADPIPTVVYSSWGRSKGAEIYMWVRLAFGKFLPMILILVFATLLTCSIVKTYYGPRKTSMNCHYKMKLQSNICWMVLCVSLLVVLGHSLEPIVHTEIYAFLFGECQVFDKTHRILRLVSTTLEVMLYAFKFPIYCAFHPEFGRNLKNICTSKKNRVGNGELKSTSVAETSHTENSTTNR